MKDILVHLDASKHTPARVAAATALAVKSGARLTGLFAQGDADRMAAIARRPSDRFVAAAAEAASLFAEATQDAGIATRWWQMPHGEPGTAVTEFAFCARYFDLVVMGQTDSKEDCVPEEMVEQVVLNCARPVLVLPHAATWSSVAERVVVAWNAGKESTRAVHDALPLLSTAKAVTVLSMRSRSSDENSAAIATMPQVDILDHLRSYGVPAEGEHLPDENIGKMDMLLSRACDLGADLLVMGAHGHYGLAALRGSGTRYVLKHMTLPVLMSN
jgi:nucleotide-binding universal stress UspA family protein